LGYPTLFLGVAAVYSLILAYCSRIFSPKEIFYPPDKKNDKETSLYLNINLCYECWPDLRKFKFLTVVDGYLSKLLLYYR
jgi:hypothetical protein